MTVKIDHIQKVLSTEGGTQNFTIPGFGTPKGALLLITKATSDGTPVDGARLGYGFTDGTNNFFVGMRSAHNLSTSLTRRAHHTGRCIICDADDLENGSAHFNQWVTDGLQITFDDNAEAAYLITVILFGGTTFDCAILTISADDGVISSLSKEYDSLFVGGAGMAPDDLTFHTIFSSGLADNQTVDVNKGLCFVDQDGVSTTVLNANLDSANSSQQVFVGSQQWAAKEGTFTATGFTQTATSGSPGSDEISIFAMKFGGLKHFLGSVNSPTSTGNWATTAYTFKPQFMLQIA